MLEDLTELFLDLSVNMDDVMRGPLTDTADDQTAIIPSPSGEPPLVYCGAAYESHRVAVQIRRADGVQARNRAQAIYDAALAVRNATAGDSLFHEVIPQTAPFWLDEDDNGRSIYAVNLEVRRSQT